MEGTNILTGLRDMEGIIGSFVVSSDGAVVGRDLPSVFDDDTLHGVAPRLVRLREGIASDSVDPAAMVLRYSEHKLHIRPVGEGLLCVLSESSVNTPALRVGMKLVARRITALLQQPAREIPSSTAPPVTERSPVPQAVAPTAAPPPARAAEVPSKAPSGMIYRGQRIG
jgi:predicted regulator of Ras-like GTPase activity (Roadblock/LC7/MglB family)